MLNLDDREAVDQLVGPFSDLVLLDQDCFKGEGGWKELLQLIPDSKIVENLQKKWALSEGRSSIDKWTDLKDEIKAFYKTPEEKVSYILKIVYFIDVLFC